MKRKSKLHLHLKSIIYNLTALCEILCSNRNKLPYKVNWTDFEKHVVVGNLKTALGCSSLPEISSDSHYNHTPLEFKIFGLLV